jgi:hypothetical protein
VIYVEQSPDREMRRESGNNAIDIICLLLSINLLCPRPRYA